MLQHHYPSRLVKEKELEFTIIPKLKDKKRRLVNWKCKEKEKAKNEPEDEEEKKMGELVKEWGEWSGTLLHLSLGFSLKPKQRPIVLFCVWWGEREESPWKGLWKFGKKEKELKCHKKVRQCKSTWMWIWRCCHSHHQFFISLVNGLKIFLLFFLAKL